MTRTPNPRFIADVRLAIELSGIDEADAERRLEAIVEFLRERTERSTFQRLAGMPQLVVADIISDVVPA